MKNKGDYVLIETGDSTSSSY